LETSNAVSIVETSGRIVHVIAGDDAGVVANTECELRKLGAAREEVQASVPVIKKSTRNGVVVSGDGIVWEEKKLFEKLVYYLVIARTNQSLQWFRYQQLIA
jgi:hypothetical protein